MLQKTSWRSRTLEQIFFPSRLDGLSNLLKEKENPDASETDGDNIGSNFLSPPPFSVFFSYLAFSCFKDINLSKAFEPPTNKTITKIHQLLLPNEDLDPNNKIKNKVLFLAFLGCHRHRKKLRSLFGHRFEKPTENAIENSLSDSTEDSIEEDSKSLTLHKKFNCLYTIITFIVATPLNLFFFVANTLSNTLKLIVLAIDIINTGVSYLYKLLGSSNSKNSILAGLKIIPVFLLAALSMLLNVLSFIVNAIINPFGSAKIAYEAGKYIGGKGCAGLLLAALFATISLAISIVAINYLAPIAIKHIFHGIKFAYHGLSVLTNKLNHSNITSNILKFLTSNIHCVTQSSITLTLLCLSFNFFNLIPKWLPYTLKAKTSYKSLKCTTPSIFKTPEIITPYDTHPKIPPGNKKENYIKPISAAHMHSNS